MDFALDEGVEDFENALSVALELEKMSSNVENGSVDDFLHQRRNQGAAQGKLQRGDLLEEYLLLEEVSLASPHRVDDSISQLEKKEKVVLVPEIDLGRSALGDVEFNLLLGLFQKQEVIVIQGERLEVGEFAGLKRTLWKFPKESSKSESLEVRVEGIVEIFDGKVVV